MGIKFKHLKEAYTAKLIKGPQTLPTNEEIRKFVIRYNDYHKNGKDAKWNHTPWGFARSTKDSYKKMYNFVLGVLVEWTELTNLLVPILVQDGYSKQELKEILDWVLISGHLQDILDELNNAFADENLTENIDQSLDEDIEKHDELNPKLFEENKLKPEVREKMLAIVDEFEKRLTEAEIKIQIDDILFIGSNASYNYTKDSDIDLHIIANDEALDCSEKHLALLYGAYRTIFKHKMEIDFYGIPVELYVETNDSPRVSNGIYSVLNDEWVKEPEQQDIPEIDMDAFKAEYDIWEAKCKDLQEKAKKDASVTPEDVETLIAEIYEQRQAGLTEGEYSIGNLIFKELRNVGILDELKELQDELTSKELSLKESRKPKIRFKK
ncbi:MAG: hypothetical protein J6A25_00470 [Lachnospiraceae bacterium]|nr:hypothetical protein [Lachnospiraceae bacterium]